MTDRAAVARVIAEEKPVAAIHFAASIEVGESIRNPSGFYWNNVVNALGLFDALVAAEVGAVVFSSTAAVYGNARNRADPRAHPTLPINPYGRDQAGGGAGAEMVRRGLWPALDGAPPGRGYFNAAGADPDGAIGEAHTRRRI